MQQQGAPAFPLETCWQHRHELATAFKLRNLQQGAHLKCPNLGQNLNHSLAWQPQQVLHSILRFASSEAGGHSGFAASCVWQQWRLIASIGGDSETYNPKGPCCMPCIAYICVDHVQSCTPYGSLSAHAMGRQGHTETGFGTHCF